MPKYIFECTQCKSESTAYVSSSVTEKPCEICHNIMKRKLPNLKGPTEVREVVDQYTNRKWNKDQDQILKKRKEDHFWEHEVPKLVQTYSVETCLEEGWLVYNDKGELVINKPPSKR